MEIQKKNKPPPPRYKREKKKMSEDNRPPDVEKMKQLLREMHVPEEFMEKFTGPTLVESQGTRMSKLAILYREGVGLVSVAA